MIGNRFYTWFKNYYQWVGGAFNETLLLPLVRATAGLRAGAIRYDETTNTVETYDGTNWNAIPSASGFVPYTGATQDVNLGEQGLEAGYLQLDTTPTGTPADQGTIYWDIDAETAALIMNGTVQKVGEDVFFHVQNKTGSPIAKGTAVRFAGTDGNSGKILIAPFLANGTYPSQYFMGVTSETIADGAFGKVYHFGKIRGVNTQAYNAGDILYASTTIAGGFQTTPPVAPNNIIVVAAVISKANNGTLMIRSTLGSNINNDEGVLISGAANNQGLFYENGLWKNKTIATVLGYTPGTVSSVGIVTGSTGTDINVSNSPVTVSGNITLNIPTASATNRGALSSSDWSTFNNKVSTSRQLTINGTAFDLSADRSWSVGTVTSVAASAPLSVSGSATTTPVITISQANSTTNGFLSSTDWNTFNNKQNTLSVTTTGNSGASTLVGSTLNVPEYTISGLGGVPTTRQLTINGTAFDLSANRSWSVGTVTSVGLTSSTSGVTITDSPVTVSGTIGIAIATANGSQQGLLSSTDWTTFNNKQNTLSLTTTGTSGAATLIGATLNVPQYQAQGNYITSLTGEATASGPGAASVTLSTTAVTGKLLTGLNLSGGGTIAATDSILTAFGKVQNQISAMVGGVMYQGTWNASTNTPTLTSSVGVKGYYYIVDVSGTTTLNGISDWRVGDWAIFNGSTWDKVDNTDAVSSVNGFTGAVSLTTSHIAEGTNLYYLDSRSRTAISLTTTGNSGAATYSSVSGIINVPQYTLTGLGGVPTTRQLTINGTAFDLSADRSWNVGTVTSVGLNSTTSGITITNTPVTGSGALTINIATASGSQNGLLSSSDWTTFNNKQNALTNPVTGTGVSGQVAYFNGTSTITGESNLFWDAANDRLGIGKNNPGANLDVVGSGIFTSNVLARAFYAVGDNMTSGGFFALPQFNSANFAGVTYTSLYALGTTTFGINYNQGATFRNAVFSATAISDNATRTYTLPNADGTLALTSAVSGSTGQVAYFSGTNSVTGESNLFWDAANDRLGIGTPTPVTNLDVNASIAGAYSTSSSQAVARLYNITNAGGINSSVISFQASTDSGSSNPVARIGVVGESAGSNNGAMIMMTRDGSGVTERMRISSSGNLGLGVTPSAWGSNFRSIDLHSLVGSISSSGAGPGDFSLSSNAFNDGTNWVYKYTGGASMRYRLNENGFAWFTAPSGTAGNAINFTQAMTLDSNGSLLVRTNANPYNIASLVVNHNSTFNRSYFQRGVELIEIQPSDGTSANLISSSYTSAGSAYKPLGISGRQDASDLRLMPNGNILVGTTTDTGQRLQVSGAATFSSNITATSATANNGSTHAGWFLSGNDSSAIWAAALGLQHNSNVTITTGASIGISFAPLASTGSSFYGSAAIKAVRPNATANNQDTDLAFWTRSGASNATTDSEKMRITSGGNVGIGTTTPGATFNEGLQVTRSSTSRIGVQHTNTTGARQSDILFSVNSTNLGQVGIIQGFSPTFEDQYWVRCVANLPLTFRTNDTERMRIHSNGGLKFNPQSAAPTAEAGTVYYDSDDNKLKVYNGTSWVDLH